MAPEPRPLELRTADGVALAAEAWPAPGPAASAVVVVHGFTSHRRDPAVLAMVDELRAAGHAVVTYDMRGHGESGGLCTLGDAERHDVAAAAAAARSLAPRIVLVGASLGAVAVLRHAVDDADLAGVVTVSAPARWRLRTPRAALAALLTRTGAGRRVARRLGARLDTAWRWAEPPDELAGRLALPLAVVHGTGDRFMPSGEAEILHAAGAAATRTGGGPATGTGARRRLDVVPGMGHAFCARGLAAISAAVGWCLAEPVTDRAA
ncbi:MAG TPA: alpha/beta fold hydrolase [Acidimicrobiales bacterium]